jgi:hypothetical protein
VAGVGKGSLSDLGIGDPYPHLVIEDRVQVTNWGARPLLDPGNRAAYSTVGSERVIGTVSGAR